MPLVERSGSGGSGKLVYANFNQDHQCFAVGTNDGFRIYNTSPFKELSSRTVARGGFGQVEMLYRCNYIGLVGNAFNTQFPPNTFVLWDELESQVVVTLEFRAAIRGIRLRRDRILITLQNKIYVYTLDNTPKLLEVYDTADNPSGVMAVSRSSTLSLMCFPAPQKGRVKVVPLDAPSSAYVFSAHNGVIASMALSTSGEYLATASEKGTMIRVFSTTSGELRREFRRGTEPTNILSISFSEGNDALCVTSGKGTVHIFHLRSSTQQTSYGRTGQASGGSDDPTKGSEFHDSVVRRRELAPNQRSAFSVIRKVLPKYFSSEWSFAQYHIPDESNMIAAFGLKEHTVMVITESGKFYEVSYDATRGGQCAQESYVPFLDAASS